MFRESVTRPLGALGLVVFCLVLLCLIVAPPTATAQNAAEGVALERFVPADAAMYVEVPSIGKAIDGLKQHPFAMLFEDGEVKAFLKPMMAVLEQQGQQSKQMLGLDPAQIMALMSGRLQLAFVGVTHGDKGPRPDLTAAISFGDRAEDARKLVTRLIEMARDGGHVEDVKLGETPAWRFTEAEMLVFFAHGSLIADTNRARAERILAGKPGEITPLVEDANYRAVAAKVGASGAHAHYYINFRRMFALIMESNPAGELTQEMFDKVMTGLGLKELSGMGSSIAFGPRGVTERVYMSLPAERTGILKLFATLKPGLSHPQQLSDNTVAYLGKRVDLLAAYDIILDVVGGLVRELSPDEADEMDDYLQKAESGVWGFKLRDDLLASLGEEFGLSMGLRMGSMIPDALLTMEIRDRAKVTSLVEHLRSTLPTDEVTVSRVPVGDYTMLTFKVKNVPVLPAVAVLDNTLVAGLFAPSVRRYLRGYRKSLADNAAFKDGLASAGLQDLSTTPVFFYVDMQRVIAYLYDNFGPLLASMDPAEMDLEIPGFDQLDFALLPTTEALVRPFKPWVVTAKADQDGFSSTATGPLILDSMQMMVGLCGALWAAPRRVAEEAGAPEIAVVREEIFEEKPVPVPTVSLGIEADDLGGGGIRITAVEAGGAAAAAGLKDGDKVTAFDGKPLRDVDHALTILAAKKPGQTLTVALRRGKEMLTLVVTLKVRSPAPTDPTPQKN